MKLVTPSLVFGGSHIPCVLPTILDNGLNPSGKVAITTDGALTRGLKRICNSTMPDFFLTYVLVFPVVTVAFSLLYAVTVPYSRSKFLFS